MAELGWSSGGGAVTVAGGLRPSVTDVGAELLFEKVLTPCDATSRGRIVLPKKAATEHFKCEDGKVGLTVVCEDTFGNEHTIVHRFWSNSKSRMYLLEGLESVFRVYKVAPGDVLVVGRMPSSKLVLACRNPEPGDAVHLKSRRGGSAGGDKPAKSKAAAAAAPTVATRRAKRARLLEQQESVDSEEPEDADYFLPPPDGVFRAVPPGAPYAPQPQVADHGYAWSSTIDVCGEPYQAFFPSLAEAVDAFTAAGYDVGVADDFDAAAYEAGGEEEEEPEEGFEDAAEAGSAMEATATGAREEAVAVAAGTGVQAANEAVGEASAALAANQSAAHARIYNGADSEAVAAADGAAFSDAGASVADAAAGSEVAAPADEKDAVAPAGVEGSPVAPLHVPAVMGHGAAATAALQRPLSAEAAGPRVETQ